MNRERRLPLLAAALGLLAMPGSALAQQVGEFAVQRFEPATGSKNLITVEGARMEGNLGWTAGAYFNYSLDPFVLQGCASQTACGQGASPPDTHVIRDQFSWDLLTSLSPIPRLQLGLRVPMSYVNGDGLDPTTGGPVSGGLRAFGVGDPDLEAKVRFLGDSTSPTVLAGAVDVSFPLGHAIAPGDYLGDSSPVTVGIRGIYDGRFGPLSLGANLRALLREDATIGNTSIGPEFRYGAGAGYQVSPIFQLLAEGFGATRFSGENGTNTLEVDGALRIHPLGWPVAFTAGGGAGVIGGVGAPAARGFAGLLFMHEDGDKDGDGIIDRLDPCPTVPEDVDGFEDADGCPDPDNDQDGIPDLVDRCPNVPETVNGFQDEDGCPDVVPDFDKDGIPDSKDACPTEGGNDIILVPGKYYGCPDRDHDGIPDSVDKCPDQPETINDFEDADGCPDAGSDRDHDGIPDAIDKCPDQPETYNGFEDADGCPDKGPTLVKVTGEAISLLQRVEFANNSDKIQGKSSFAVLDAVAGALNGHADILLVEIAGHTDNTGLAAQNRTLSQRRAEAVVAYLVTKGVAKERLQAKGYGPDKPIADNKSSFGRQKNRRVELNILSSTKKR